MMGEDEVRSAAVDLEVDPEQLLGHRRALDVPARAPGTPRCGPARVLAGLLRLPQREVEWVALAVGAVDPVGWGRLGQGIDVAVGEPTVLGLRAHREVHVAVDRVGVPGVDEALDERDDPAHAPGGERLGVGTTQPERVGVGEVMSGHLLGEAVAAHAHGCRGGVDLVVDVSDVGDELHRVSLVLEEPFELGEDDERASVADVHAPVHGRSAGVDPHPVLARGLDRPHSAGARVVEGHRPHRR